MAACPWSEGACRVSEERDTVVCTALTSIGRKCVDDLDNHGALEEYWTTHGKGGDTSVLQTGTSQQFPSESPGKLSAETENKRNSQQSMLGNGQIKEPVLSPEHPALAMHDFLDTFGPLIFPLYRAALLRKRILLLGHPPVQQLCNFGEKSQ